MGDSKKAAVALNPNAAEFYPKPKCLYPLKTMSSFNNQNYELSFFKPAKNFPGKPIQSYRYRFCNRKLPPRLLKKKVWVHKNQNLSPPPPQQVMLQSHLADKSSVMIKNIPNNLGRKDLLRILDRHCWKENNEDGERQIRSSYDFLYLPMDFVKHANLGYAFVNFTSSLAAHKFQRDFQNFFWHTPGNKKYCQITLAKFQGKEELSKHFQDSRFPCHTDDYLPVVLSPPSDGFTGYSLTTLGNRIRTRGGGLDN